MNAQPKTCKTPKVRNDYDMYECDRCHLEYETQDEAAESKCLS